MRRQAAVLLLLALGALAGGAGCSSVEPVLEVHDPAPFERGVSFHVRPFTAETAQQKVSEGGARFSFSLKALGIRMAQRVRRELDAHLQNAEMVPLDARVPAGLVIEGEIIEAEEGNRALRQFLGFGLGETVLHVKARVVRASDEVVVAEYDCRRTGQFGLFGGRARDLIEEDLRGHGRDMARWLASLSVAQQPE